ncbi:MULTISPECIES: alpha-galactosidase [unclassified Pedobacter]|uniref:alpha-galactosidase n=1 Tax=unclassified Pedobacter TaxID=2628915 RepID=UPI001E6553ED|nr:MULTISPECIES: alpha-galactosidase [unclassified Pedobacter]
MLKLIGLKSTIALKLTKLPAGNPHPLYKVIILLFAVVLNYGFAEVLAQQIPVWKSALDNLSTVDWLVHAEGHPAAVFKSADQKDIILSNGLLKRVFRLSPNVACTDLRNLTTGEQLLRSVKPEAQVSINGKKYNIGGLYGQTENAYITTGILASLKANARDFQFQEYEITALPQFIKWIPGSMWTANKKNPTGKTVTFTYKSADTKLNGVLVKVNYALYDGLPLMTKWVTVENKTDAPIKIDQVVNEVLGVVEEESAVVGGTDKMKTPHGIYIESNFAFNNAMKYSLSDQSTHWKADSLYTSQVNYDKTTPCLLEVYPDKGVNVELAAGEVFSSIRTNELLMDSYDRERRGLAIRKMYRVIAPWTTQNPIFMHLVSKNDQQVKNAIDQCAVTGYEALILSFGSHMNMEDSTALNIQKWKNLAEYAHAKNIKIGGYSLFSSRRISDEDDVISPLTGKPGGAFFGNAPCFGSKWGLSYRDKIKYFFQKTGFDIWENDGPYPGDVCASTTHPGHKGLADSQWTQMEMQKELYHWLSERGVYINAPDWYFLDGTNKIAIGYREVNFSLPRTNQMILNRQNIFDGTWEKTPSMGWGFVPLTAYQGGGAEAVLEPLADHLKDYQQLMMQYYGAGVQACYRGPRLYDTEATKETVKGVINWYKQYRDILNSDIIHLRRADGRDWDGILHVNPSLKTKGLLMVYNPLGQDIERVISVPLYYAGITRNVVVTDEAGKKTNYVVDASHKIQLKIKIKAEGYTWLKME